MTPERARRLALWMVALAALVHCMFPTPQVHYLSGRVVGIVMGLSMLVMMLRFFRHAAERILDHLTN